MNYAYGLKQVCLTYMPHIMWTLERRAMILEPGPFLYVDCHMQIYLAERYQ